VLKKAQAGHTAMTVERSSEFRLCSDARSG
jgi:hypothetical protein